MSFCRNKLIRRAVPLTVVGMLGACGGADGQSSYLNSSLPSDKCSAYVNVISPGTRFNASAFPQCSALITNADTYLAAAINACAEGNLSAANNYYSLYRKLVESAISVVSTLCPA
jgi:hypothetical protein